MTRHQLKGIYVVKVGKVRPAAQGNFPRQNGKHNCFQEGHVLKYRFLDNSLSKLIEKYRASKKDGFFDHNFSTRTNHAKDEVFSLKRLILCKGSPMTDFFSTPSIPYLHPAGFLQVSPLEKRRASLGERKPWFLFVKVFLHDAWHVWMILICLKHKGTQTTKRGWFPTKIWERGGCWFTSF